MCFERYTCPNLFTQVASDRMQLCGVMQDGEAARRGCGAVAHETRRMTPQYSLAVWRLSLNACQRALAFM